MLNKLEELKHIAVEHDGYVFFIIGGTEDVLLIK